MCKTTSRATIPHSLTCASLLHISASLRMNVSFLNSTHVTLSSFLSLSSLSKQTNAPIKCQTLNSYLRSHMLTHAAPRLSSISSDRLSSSPGELCTLSPSPLLVKSRCPHSNAAAVALSHDLKRLRGCEWKGAKHGIFSNSNCNKPPPDTNPVI